MTLKEYKRIYKSPEKVTPDYAFSRDDWPRVADWLKANGVEFCHIDVDSVFGPGKNGVNCLCVQGSELKHWDIHQSAGKLAKAMQTGREGWDLKDVTLLHPSVIRGINVPKMDF